MESSMINHYEEQSMAATMIYSSSTTDQEVDQTAADQENSFGVGRSYECVFCRRGFNTAQALGGHMNIHRKDRARNNGNNNIYKPTTTATATSSSCTCMNTTVPTYFYKPDDDHEVESLRLKSCTNYYNYNHNFLASSSSSSTGAAAVISSSSSSSSSVPVVIPFYHGNHHQYHSSPLGEDGRRGLGRMRLSPLMGSSGHADLEISMTRLGGIQQEELDLELRL